ncbi:MAG: DNA recombination protein RmuC [Bacteroidetes bacterium]|nr:MAG: DNA recombination protein RmuC [Bacteroidota bacterium]
MEEKYIYAIISGLIGAALVYLWLKQKLSTQVATLETQLKGTTDTIAKGEKAFVTSQQENESLTGQIQAIHKIQATLEAEISSLNVNIARSEKSNETTQQKLDEKTITNETLNVKVASLSAAKESLEEKLANQKTEIEAMGVKFNTEFENIATKILETNSTKFATQNKDQLKSILEPLGKNISEFKTKVEEVYDKESKERFSLGEKVKELSSLNLKISQDAINLTKALKGEAKTQGRWGEMILESILEKSGLRKNEEYFLEEFLKDEEGNFLKSESEGKKMRPDAIIKYPDNRNVIIDSKVSLNAFTRYLASDDVDEQKAELAAHVTAIKFHIDDLSKRGYDDYNKALDFVLMFVPSEPAYIAAMQGDGDLWNYAYDKRVLLMNPTNLITALKLIMDLWKREYQNQNAIEIASRGQKLYDKFVGFIENLEGVGNYIEKAQGKYNDAYKQLKSGNDNLVLQADKLKKLGLKTKKELNPTMVEEALIDGKQED